MYQQHNLLIVSRLTVSHLNILNKKLLLVFVHLNLHICFKLSQDELEIHTSGPTIPTEYSG